MPKRIVGTFMIWKCHWWRAWNLIFGIFSYSNPMNNCIHFFIYARDRTLASDLSHWSIISPKSSIGNFLTSRFQSWRTLWWKISQTSRARKLVPCTRYFTPPNLGDKLSDLKTILKLSTPFNVTVRKTEICYYTRSAELARDCPRINLSSMSLRTLFRTLFRHNLMLVINRQLGYHHTWELQRAGSEWREKRQSTIRHRCNWCSLESLESCKIFTCWQP
jgi:hypothetical protein